MTRLLTRGLISLLAVTPGVAVASTVQLSSVSVHLFLTASGTFTDDVTAMKGFGARNFTPFADGQDFGHDTFHAVLVKVAFTSQGETFEKGQVAQLTVSDSKTGKVILKRSIAGLYVGPGGRSVVPVLINGHECQELRVEVKSGGTTIQRQLPFKCGE